MKTFLSGKRCGGRLAEMALLMALLGGVAVGLPSATRAQTASDALQFSQRAPAVGSARVLGQGGTGRAGIAGTSALYYNPAGLGWMKASAATGALAIVGTGDEARYQVGTLDPTRQSESVSDFGGHFALAYEFPTQRGSLVLAGAYNQVNTFGRAFSFAGRNNSNSVTDTFLPESGEYFIGEDGRPAFPPEEASSLLPFVAYEAGAVGFYPGDEYPFRQAVVPGTTVEQRGTVTRDGRTQELNLGAGVEAAPGVMLGGSANVSLGTYRYENEYVEEDVLDENRPQDFSIPLEGGTLRGFDRLTYNERFESNLAGLNLRGGVSAKARPGVRVGATVETPTFYQVDEEFTQAEITMVFDEGFGGDNTRSYGNLPEDEGIGESKYRVRTPWRLGAGAQISLLPLTGGVADLTLSADVEFLDWSQLDLDSDAVDLDGPNSPDVFADENFQSVVNTNLGAELRVGGAALRAGFASRPDPVEGEFELDSGETTDASRVAYSLGAGYRFAENVRVNVAWLTARYDQQYRPYASPDPVPGESEGITAPYVDQDITRNRFFVGVRYAF